ncbi:DUF4190 domain-containing protein [Cryobacterium sp. Hb1]|uniref:DUF4190 domain-containing protein n=1 Tax=Cryobacterium sp. Hb1 TaxID=1259147 RepID=UPI00106D65D9|nr:DUF4190 domain-containing protein [Cryobacterium sp. Hb1]TFD71828.1 DUF4190 domain-containing protein [Cryobacterium sp. Hb1]
MSDPTQPPANPENSDPTRSRTTGPSAPPAYETPSAPAYPAAPSYQATGGQEAPGYGQPPAYGQNPYGQQNPQDKYNVLSIISLVTSILLVSVVGIVTGHIALSQIKKTGEKGRGLALWGTILGYVGLLGGTIFTIITIAFVIAAASTGAGYYR